MRGRVGSLFVVLILLVGGLVGLLNFGSENAKAPFTFVGGIVYDGFGGPWNLAGSPYIVIGDVIVPEGKFLTIEPSVQVKFDGYYKMYVDGNLSAIGTESNRITITSNKTNPSSGDWIGINVNSTGHAEIKYSDLSYGHYGLSLWISSNNNITDNIITNSSLGGIHVRSSSRNTLRGNLMFNNGMGIDISGTGGLSCGNIITNNNIISSEGSGISIYLSLDNNITNNNVSYNGQGISLASSSNNIMTNNNVLWNSQEGIYISSSRNNMIIGNNVSSNTRDGIRLDPSSDNYIMDNIISKNSNGISLSDLSDGNIITNNSVLFNKADGIKLSSSSNNFIKRNNVSLNKGTGIWFSLSSDNSIADNIIVSNNEKGIYLGGGGFFEPSENNEITGNIVSSNVQYGIDLFVSINNRIYHNNFINNMNQVSDSSNLNLWNLSYPSGGNYWSDFDEVTEGCTDNYNGAVSPQRSGSSDGICDNQYKTGFSNGDYYPLTTPFGLDITPPAITTLSIGAVTDNSIEITWKAPGDDNNAGTANHFDLRYSTTGPITDENWDLATQIEGVPPPKSGGSSISYMVTGLSPNTQYWFALKTADEVPNWSIISNSPNATTFPDATIYRFFISYWWVLLLLATILIFPCLFLLKRIRKKSGEELNTEKNTEEEKGE